MSALIISIVVVLLVIFLIIALSCLLNTSKSVISTSADINIESRLRLIMMKNPNAEIYVLDTTNSDETKEILSRLQKDYPNIHIRTSATN